MTSYAVSGLSPNVNYTIWVVAVNQGGSGQPSSVSVVTLAYGKAKSLVNRSSNIASQIPPGFSVNRP